MKTPYLHTEIFTYWHADIPREAPRRSRGASTAPPESGRGNGPRSHFVRTSGQTGTFVLAAGRASGPAAGSSCRLRGRSLAGPVGRLVQGPIGVKSIGRAIGRRRVTTCRARFSHPPQRSRTTLSEVAATPSARRIAPSGLGTSRTSHAQPSAGGEAPAWWPRAARCSRPAGRGTRRLSRGRRAATSSPRSPSAGRVSATRRKWPWRLARSRRHPSRPSSSTPPARAASTVMRTL